MKPWFEIDKEGLRALQEGKPKAFILRELIQNAWDEPGVSECRVTLEQKNGSMTVTVEDDAPEGFQNLKDAFTLFGKTRKWTDPGTRGRFNLGEKQALSRCKWGRITTTKGMVLFSDTGRHTGRNKLEAGSRIEVSFSCNRAEGEEILEIIRGYIPPEALYYFVNGEEIPWKICKTIITARLLTEIEEEGILKRRTRETTVEVFEQGGAVLYELGLPVQEIPESRYSLNVIQKVPLGVDRETVLPSFLRDLYAQVLNAMKEEVSPEESSQGWIRQAFSSPAIEPEAVRAVVKARFGERAAIATPGEPVANDDALAKGYNLVHGSEMSKEEWEAVREAEALQSSKALFGKTPSDEWEPLKEEELTPGHRAVQALTRELGWKLFDFTPGVEFIRFPKAAPATYSRGTVTFNVSELGNGFFTLPLGIRQVGLVLHELAHRKGMHTEEGYHKALSGAGAKLALLVLAEPEWFRGLLEGRAV